MVSASYMLDHCRGELGRGHVHRCPISWLRVAKREAQRIGDEDMAEACSIALMVARGEGSYHPPDADSHRPQLRTERLKSKEFVNVT
jgi:hypothetical protein